MTADQTASVTEPSGHSPSGETLSRRESIGQLSSKQVPPRVVDLHHHFIPRAVFDDLARQAGGARRLLTDRISVTLNPVLPDIDAHLGMMAEAAVDEAVLTYAALSVLGTGVCRQINDALATVAADHASTLHGAVHVDIDQPAQAVAELHRGLDELSMRAVALPTSGLRRYLDDPELYPLWELITDRQLPVILHPVSLAAGSSTDYAIERSCARPFETTTAAIRLLYGVVPRFPALRFVAPHCGGTLAVLKGRIQMFFTPPGGEPRSLPRTQSELAAEGLDTAFDDLWSHILVDTAGNGGWTPITRMALDVFGPDRVCFGSDFPLESHSAATISELIAAIVSLGLDESLHAAVLGGNAAGLLSSAY